jgi:uncharacterized protein (TIGR03437 family)
LISNAFRSAILLIALALCAAGSVLPRPLRRDAAIPDATARSPLATVMQAAAADAQFIITTVAGSGRLAFSGAGQPASSIRLFGPQRMAADANGNIYVSDSYYHQVFRIGPDGTVQVVAGTGAAGFGGDGGPAVLAALNYPSGLAADSAGNLYIADSLNARVRRVSPQGVITTIAGVGVEGSSGDGGPAAQAQLGSPDGLCLDSAGNLYIADPDQNRVRRVTPDGVIFTFAGDGVSGFSGDGASAIVAHLNSPVALTADRAGNIYIADQANGRIRRVSPTGIITTVAGSGQYGFSGDGGSALKASFADPFGLALDSAGNLYIADFTNHALRRVDLAGRVTTIAGQGASFNFSDGSPAGAAAMFGVADVLADGSSGLLTLEFTGRRISRIQADGGIARFAGVPLAAPWGDGGPAASAVLLDPRGSAFDAAGNLFVADPGDHRLRKIYNGVISSVAGTGVPSADLSDPSSVAVDTSGNLFFSDDARVGLLSAGGSLSTVAGRDAAGFAGDGGPASKALMSTPQGLASDSTGNLYIADTDNFRVRRMDAADNIDTIAGTGVQGSTGDGGRALEAKLTAPVAVAVDAAGSVYIADIGANRVRKISPSGVITTVAGDGQAADKGDGGLGTAASLAHPASVAVDGAGNLYIATTARIRRIDRKGVIDTVAGTGATGFGGDGDLAALAQLSQPTGLAIDASGAVFFSDEANARIRRLGPAQVTPAGVLNAASSLQGAVAPGEFVNIIAALAGAGTAIAQVNPDGRLATTLNGVQALFDGVPAALLYLQPNRLGAIVPYSVAGKQSVSLQVTFHETTTNAVVLPVAETAPAIFTSAGQALALNQDGSINSPANPAQRGSVISLFGTGAGQTDPPGTDGLPARDPLPKPLLPLSAQIGGVDAPVLYAGAAPGLAAGMLQVNVRIPDSILTQDKSLSVQLTIGGKSSQPEVTVSVQ